MSGPVIHITIGKANPERANGVNSAVHGMAVAMGEKGLGNEVWGITPTPSAPTPERSYPLRLFQFSKLRFRLDPQLKAALEELPSSAIVHLHSGFLPEFYLVARILHRRGIPWVLTPHGCYARIALQRGVIRKRVFMALFDKFIISNASGIQALAANSTDGLKGVVSPARVAVIPNGCAAPEEPLADPGGQPFRFSFCGRFSLCTKGLDLLMGGLGLASKGGQSVTLELLGDGRDRAAVEEHMRAAGVEDLVHMHGMVFGEEKRRALVGSSCFVLTSRHEGFPIALVEAASLGLPLLVTEGTNFADYVRRWDCGLVVPALTKQSIGESMLTMAALPPERLREMGSNSVRLVRGELSWERIADRIINEVYLPIWEGQA